MPRLTSQIQQLKIPFEPDSNHNWMPCPVFDGATADNWILTCHVSALRPNTSPHSPHRHPEEEILVVLSGEVNLILPERPLSLGGRHQRLGRGQFAYYPAGYVHTLMALGTKPANYLMFKWYSPPIRNTPYMQFGTFTAMAASPENDTDPETGFRTRLLFEEQTGYLRKLHCHASTLTPSSGYDTHIDPYDVAIIVLEGQIRTLGETLKPNSVVYYAAGEPHSMQNPGNAPARYLVFEFHGNQIGFGNRCLIWLRSLIIRLTDPKKLLKGMHRFIGRLFKKST